MKMEIEVKDVLIIYNSFKENFRFSKRCHFCNYWQEDDGNKRDFKDSVHEVSCPVSIIFKLMEDNGL